MEKNSLHPLAKAIVEAAEGEIKEAEDFKEVAGEGVYFRLDKKQYFVGRRSENLKGTAVELFCEDKLLGTIYLEDTLKESAISACAQLKNMGVKIVMLSGDNAEVAERIAQQVGVDEWKSQLLPQDKYAWIENTKTQKGNFVGYVGDGLNDAPSLMLADVGMSMGIKGASSSIEASDVVLVDDNPEKVCSAIKISKFTRKIVWENIILSAAIKVVFLALGAAGVTGMLSAVIADVGVTLLAILNSLRALKYKGERKVKKTA